jgi:hypothetical protein
MKSLGTLGTLGFAAAIAAAPVSALAQDTAVVAEAPEEYYPSNAIMLNPLSALLGLAFGLVNVSIEYDHAFTDWLGLNVTPSFTYWKFSGVEIIGGGVELGPRFMPSSDKLDGFFVQPLFVFLYYTGEDTDNGTTAEVAGGAIGAAVDVGYTWTWAPGFALGLSGGIAYTQFIGDLEPYQDDRPLPVTPRLNLTLGYSW